MERTENSVSLTTALIPVFFLVIALAVTIVLFKLPAHIPLVCAAAVAAAVALARGHSWQTIENGMIHGITLALPAVLILLVVGIMIGTWIQGGIVPAMIFYGLKLLSPGIFLAAAFVTCTIVALGTGSSWSTAGTIGVALIGVGGGLGVPLPMVAGAIISGAYFGDKMSPLSDTTNLAPAVSGTDVFSHVRHMIYTGLPAFFIALALYFVLGLKFSSSRLESGGIETILRTLDAHFTIHPALLAPPLLIIVMVVLRIKPLPALFGGTVIGSICAAVFQSRSLKDIVSAAQTGFPSATGVPAVDDLLNRGGLESMMPTVGLVICALSFGGIMERTGMLEAVAASLLRKVKRPGGLTATTVFSSLGMNVVASDQYLAIVIPGRMYKKAYDAMGLHPKNLSRALESSGTLSSPLIPWNSCGAFMHATLGISPLAYLPYAFLNLLIPVITVAYGYTGITMARAMDSGRPENEA